MIKDVKYDSNDTVTIWFEYEYHKNGSISKEKKRSYSPFYDPRGQYEEREYDENGKETKYTSFNADGTVAFGYETQYDEMGNMLRRTDIPGGSAYACEYDENGNIKKLLNINSYGTVIGWTEWEYRYE